MCNSPCIRDNWKSRANIIWWCKFCRHCIWHPGLLLRQPATPSVAIKLASRQLLVLGISPTISPWSTGYFVGQQNKKQRFTSHVLCLGWSSKYFAHIVVNKQIKWRRNLFDIMNTGYMTRVQYIPRNMHTDFALLCFVVVIHWLIFPYPSGAKQPWWIWINTSYEFIMNDCITTTKQSTTKPCAYFLGYTVVPCNVWVSSLGFYYLFTSLLGILQASPILKNRC